MANQNTVVGAALSPFLSRIRRHSPAVERVSQIDLSLHGADERTVFEAARTAILKFVEGRSGGKLPDKARAGESFSTDKIGMQPIEGIALDGTPYWTLRFDEGDNEVAKRSWVMETALGISESDHCVLFGARLQCVIGGENPSYHRSIPGFVREVIKQCDAQLDKRRAILKPWIIDTDAEVERLVELLCLPDRKADVIVISLPENSSDSAGELVSSKKLAHDLVGAAHVALISGPCAFHLSERVGREFSVFNQAVRTYRPGFDPDMDEPFAHPLGLADRILTWHGGPKAYQHFITNEALRRTVEMADDALDRLPSFAEVKRTAAELRRKAASEEGSTNEELLAFADQEIEQLKHDLESQRKEHNERLRRAKTERDDAEAEVQRLEGTNYNLRARIQKLEAASTASAEGIPIPGNLDELEDWAAEHLAGAVELHSRALRSAKQSQYEDVSLIYKALLLLRNYYVPMRRPGGRKHQNAFKQHCQELGLEEGKSVTESQAGEQSGAYEIRIGNRKIMMNRHLKRGVSREPRLCFRLYFCWHEEQVIVGWLSSHLPTRKS